MPETSNPTEGQEPPSQAPGASGAAPTRGQPGPPTSEPTPRSASRAIILLPGLADAPNNRLGPIARRLAVALDRLAVTETVRFKVAERIDEIQRPHDGLVRRAAILRQDGEREEPAIDVFEVEYAATLTRRFRDASLFRRWLQVVAFAVIGFGLVLKSFATSSAKTTAEKLQLLWGCVVLLLLVAYGIVLLAALIALFERLWGSTPITDALGAFWDWIAGGFAALWHEIAAWWPWGGEDATVAVEPVAADSAQGSSLFWQVVAVILAVTVGLRGGFAQLQSLIETAGERWVAVLAYLRFGHQRPAVTGRFADALEHVLEQRPRYDQIAVISYSFGTLVALDALFPHGREPDPHFRRVNALITIGCPFDGVRALWRAYGSDRRALRGVPPRWLNLYAPLDVFGSDFQDGDQPVPVAVDAENQEVRPTSELFRTGQAEETLSLREVLLFYGMRAHGSYWSDAEESERSCFVEVVRALYERDQVLA
jgi:hypothetical protein